MVRLLLSAAVRLIERTAKWLATKLPSLAPEFD